MANKMRVGHVIDVGHYWAVIASVWPSSPVGIELNRTGSGNMSSCEARRLAEALLRMADECDRINHEKAVTR